MRKSSKNLRSTCCRCRPDFGSAEGKVEYYEIASHGCLVTYASLMEYAKAKELLGMTLNMKRRQI